MSLRTVLPVLCVLETPRIEKMIFWSDTCSEGKEQEKGGARARTA